MFVTLLVACLAALAAARTAPPGKPSYDLNDAPNIYKAFVKKHSKVYDADEHNERFEIFKESLRKINELNEKYDYTTFDINHFADLTAEELRSYMGLKYSPRNVSSPASPPQLRDVDPPAHFDWRDSGVVTPVKNQLGCGSCYIFSAIGNIESQYAIKHKQCISLSEQQCLDCLKNNGCQGGTMADVMQYVQRLRRRRANMTGAKLYWVVQNDCSIFCTSIKLTILNKQLARDKAGCMKNSDYPYLGWVRKCDEDKNKKVVTVIKGEEFNNTDEDYLQKLLVSYGPISVALNATDLQYYHSGILSPIACDSNADHAVLLVGYGEENGRKFWIIKNSWSDRWGEKGYVKLVRGVGACGIGRYFTAMSHVA